MTTDQLFKALTWAHKPVTADRLIKAQARADSPATYQALLAKLKDAGQLPEGTA